ncbi:MAG: hypothetical protein HYW25_01670 [Candidatus Aenigmarchaeota archaeon]|nr:hypothetical protein [Candidatus Aenigmarchaeota archaeon]
MSDNKSMAAMTLVIVAVAIMAFNQYTLMSINGGTAAITGNVVAEQQNAATLQEAIDAVIPRGVPAVYGEELGVSFDKPQESLNILANLDGDLYDNGKLHFADLTAEQQESYKQIGASIACEYCCGATTLIFSNGQPACGCAHSAGMRGLAMYLLINNPEMSNEQILDELTDWKALFFPKEMVAKYMQQNGLTQGAAELPDMVGGC